MGKITDQVFTNAHIISNTISSK